MTTAVKVLNKPLIRILLVALVAVVAVALYLFQPWLLAVDKSVDEQAPQGNACPAAAFVSHEHATTGTASVITGPDGARTLRIENLDTTLGPDVRVWLSDQPVEEGRGGFHVFDDGSYLELGKLKANHGNQNYAIPDGTDLTKLGSVTIWCKRFHVSFGAATLRA